MARLVVPGYPHHVVQRGSRRQTTFFNNDDFDRYVSIFAENCNPEGVAVWAYCLMPNHVHFVLVPDRKDSLARLLRKVHATYARSVNRRHDWTGHLWQERFWSCVMDETHLMAAARYIELNPVRSGLCDRAEHWKWSSARRHLFGESDALMPTAPMTDMVKDWSSYLDEKVPAPVIDRLRKLTRTGRPVGNDQFVRQLEMLTGRRFRRHNPCPRPQKGNCPSAAKR